MLLDQKERQKQSRVDAAADAINERFGQSTLWRGSSLRGESPRTLKRRFWRAAAVV